MVIKVPIIVSYNNKGTKQAVKGIGGLEKSFKSMGLASKLSFAAATTAVTVFTKKAVAAALEESKAVAVLNKSLENLGLAFASTGINAYIDSLQRATGVSEDLLRPAFGRLIRSTNDLGKAQQLLALSLDIAASTGRSVDQVAQSLSKAYLGQTTALGRLGVGLSKAELATSSFEEIQTKLTALFAGSAAVAAQTYAGQLAKLQIAAAEASETIGVALVDAVARLGEDTGLDDTATAMQRLADNTRFAITGIAALTDQIVNNPGFKLLAGIFKLGTTPLVPGTARGGVFSGLSDFGRGVVARESTATNRQSPRVAEQAAAKAAKARKVEIADRTKIVSLTKAQTANERLARTFDLDAIQLAAALQSKLSKEDEARVKALQALKTEDKNDDIRALDELEAAKRAATLAEIARLKSVVDERKKSNADILADARAKIEALSRLSPSTAAAISLATPAIPAGQTPGFLPGPGVSNVPSLPSVGADLFTGGGMQAVPAGQTPNFLPGAPNVTVNLNGGINVGTEQEFEAKIQTALQALNTSGNTFFRAGQGP
jgi:hypothetical protein